MPRKSRFTQLHLARTSSPSASSQSCTKPLIVTALRVRAKSSCRAALFVASSVSNGRSVPVVPVEHPRAQPRMSFAVLSSTVAHDGVGLDFSALCRAAGIVFHEYSGRGGWGGRGATGSAGEGDLLLRATDRAMAARSAHTSSSEEDTTRKIAC